MEDLSLVGVHEDGEHLLLSGPNGQRFRLRVDDALRAAIRRDRARLSQIQIEAEGRLRPREIQARIRAGETAEEVAEAAGLALDHVRKYEGPVLAEREYVAEQARRVRVRRTGGAESQSLDETVTERLVAREVDLDGSSWDAWRGDDGLWVLALEYLAGSTRRQARWLYNASLRHVTAHNDEARWLSEEEPPQPDKAATARAETGSMRRLAPVRGGDRPFDQYEPERAEPGPARPAYEEPAAVNLLDTLRERRGRRNRALSDDEERAGHSDPVRDAIDTLLSRTDTMGEPPAAHPARSRPQDARDGEVLVLPDGDSMYELDGESTASRPERSDRADRADRADRPDRGDRDRLDRDRAERERSERERERAELQRRERADRERAEREQAEAAEAGKDRVVDVDAVEKEPAPVPAGRRPASGNRKQRRASVPSWDDIVFGQRRD